MQSEDQENVNLQPQENETVNNQGNLREDISRPEEPKKNTQLQLDEEDLKEIKLTSGEIEEVLDVKMATDASKGSSGQEEKDITD